MSNSGQDFQGLDHLTIATVPSRSAGFGAGIPLLRLLPFLALLALLPLLGLLADTGTADAQEITLAWKFQPGQVLTYRQTSTSRTEMPMGEMSQTQTMRLRQEVLNVAADGAADVRSTFLSLRSVMEGPMGRQEYDSERPDEAVDPALRMAGGMVGASLEITIGANGEIRSMRGTDVLMERMLAPIAEESPEEAAQVRATLEDVFGEEQLRSQMQQAMAMLPAGPIRPGHTWSAAVDVRLPFGTMRTEYTYRLDDVVTRAGRRVGVVSVSGTTGPIDPDPSNPMPGMMELSGGELTGTLEFDADRGILLDARLTTVMESELMGTPMKIEATQAMELVDG